MVRVTVRFMSIARLRAGTGGAEISSQSNRLGDVVREVVKRYGITDIILTEDGEIRPWARVFVNGRSQELAGGLDTVLSEGDRVALVFPYAEAF
jgi:molybdopterin converting factor small subunit